MSKVLIINYDICNGCYNCQVACKDEHVGNDWSPIAKPQPDTGQFWTKIHDNVRGQVPKVKVTYEHSICQHCDEAPCIESCNVKAIYKREDGVVLIDQSRCTKCNKCAADCPYSAVRASGSGAAVSKCDFCAEDLARGQPPTCVAACPNRALDWGEYDDLVKKHGGTDRVFPLADPAIARPALVIRPHRHAALVESRQPEVANWEEI